MITLLDGPAGGQSLMVRRAPLLLRVVHNGREWDALDQLHDTPAPNENVYVYVRAEDLGLVHLRVSGRTGSGFYRMAKYRHIDEVVADDALRHTQHWRDWCRANYQRLIPERTKGVTS